MNKQDYDKYYQQGGSYVIPVEIFNELFEDYECFKNDCKKHKEVIDKTIKHVSSLSSKGRGCMIYADVKKDILDILKEVSKWIIEKE